MYCGILYCNLKQKIGSSTPRNIVAESNLKSNPATKNKRIVRQSCLALKTKQTIQLSSEKQSKLQEGKKNKQRGKVGTIFKPCSRKGKSAAETQKHQQAANNHSHKKLKRRKIIRKSKYKSSQFGFSLRLLSLNMLLSNAFRVICTSNFKKQDEILDKPIIWFSPCQC